MEQPSQQEAAFRPDAERRTALIWDYFPNRCTKCAHSATERVFTCRREQKVVTLNATAPPHTHTHTSPPH